MSVRLLSLVFLTIGIVSAGGAESQWWGSHDNQEHCSLARELYPVRPTVDDWTTSEIFDKALPIDDESFRSVKIVANTTRRIPEAPDGIVSLEGFYPNGSFTFTHTPRGGFSFYAPGPEEVDLTTAQEATFAYTILFPEGFDWVKGGKLPGFCAYALSSFTFYPTTDGTYDRHRAWQLGVRILTVPPDALVEERTPAASPPA